jgi:Putative metallopeptidase
LFDGLQRQKVLEKLQLFFSPLRLPNRLLLRLKGCKGEPDAFYEKNSVTVCVEAIDTMVRSAANRAKPPGIDQKTIVVGGFFHMVLHEVSHAIFDQFKTPIFGREEDAADQLAAYVVLNLEKTDRDKLVTAAIYLFANEAGVIGKRKIGNMVVKKRLRDFSSFHSTPGQRLYNILCMAYGSDQRRFARVVKSGALPKERAEGCTDEYAQIQNAYRKLIVPHIDLPLGRKIKQGRWLSLER